MGPETHATYSTYAALFINIISVAMRSLDQGAGSTCADDLDDSMDRSTMKNPFEAVRGSVDEPLMQL